MITVQIIGTGKVARQLAIRFRESVYTTLTTVVARSKKSRDAFATTFPEINVTTLENLTQTDVTIIAVTDTAITNVSTRIVGDVGLVVHTSGSVPMEVLNAHSRYGVLYPLQSFSENKSVDWNAVPVCIESTTENDLKLLESLGKTLGPKVYHISTAQRKELHVAAVFANNFANHCFTVAHELCEDHNIPFELLHPLILETAQKAITIAPAQSQTGPAVRGDEKIIQEHLERLDADKKEIYKTLTRSIITYYGR